MLTKRTQRTSDGWSRSLRDDDAFDSDDDANGADEATTAASGRGARGRGSGAVQGDDDDPWSSSSGWSDPVDIAFVEEPRELKFVETPFTIARRAGGASKARGKAAPAAKKAAPAPKAIKPRPLPPATRTPQKKLAATAQLLATPSASSAPSQTAPPPALAQVRPDTSPIRPAKPPACAQPFETLTRKPVEVIELDDDASSSSPAESTLADSGSTTNEVLPTSPLRPPADLKLTATPPTSLTIRTDSPSPSPLPLSSQKRSFSSLYDSSQTEPKKRISSTPLDSAVPIVQQNKPLPSPLGSPDTALSPATKMSTAPNKPFKPPFLAAPPASSSTSPSQLRVFPTSSSTSAFAAPTSTPRRALPAVELSKKTGAPPVAIVETFAVPTQLKPLPPPRPAASSFVSSSSARLARFRHQPAATPPAAGNDASPESSRTTSDLDLASPAARSKPSATPPPSHPSSTPSSSTASRSTKFTLPGLSLPSGSKRGFKPAESLTDFRKRSRQDSANGLELAGSSAGGAREQVVLGAAVRSFKPGPAIGSSTSTARKKPRYGRTALAVPRIGGGGSAAEEESDEARLRRLYRSLDG
ncbi:hypothetical protein JCM8097_008873 [Rhodosporidiobolus ruineniae]